MVGVKSSADGAGRGKKRKNTRNWGKLYKTTTGAVKNMESRPGVQIIKKRIDISKIRYGNYYHRKVKEIEKQIEGDSTPIIELIPNKEVIDDAWDLELLLQMQRDVTDIVIMPKTSVASSEIQDWINFFKPKEILYESI